MDLNLIPDLNFDYLVNKIGEYLENTLNISAFFLNSINLQSTIKFVKKQKHCESEISERSV